MVSSAFWTWVGFGERRSVAGAEDEDELPTEHDEILPLEISDVLRRVVQEHVDDPTRTDAHPVRRNDEDLGDIHDLNCEIPFVDLLDGRRDLDDVRPESALGNVLLLPLDLALLPRRLSSLVEG